jgi:hypothetical protein
MFKMTKQYGMGSLFIYLIFCKQNTYLKLLNQGEFKLITYFFIYNARDWKQTKKSMSVNERSQGREEIATGNCGM